MGRPGAVLPGQRRTVLTSTRCMGAALERLLIKTQSGQPVSHCINVPGLSVMRGTGQRQLHIRQIKRIGGTTFDEKDRLQGLDCRARVDKSFDVANRRGGLAITAHHRNCAAVAALNHLTSGDLYQDRVGIHKWGESIAVSKV